MQQCVFISIFVESHNLNLMHMKQKLVRIGISGIQKQKERFCLIFPVQSYYKKVKCGKK